jgi:hypothetical protein
VAIIECKPPASEEVLKLAWPELSGTLASTVEPSLNVIVPVGAPEDVAVAVNVIDCPKVDGLGAEPSVVLVLGLKSTKGLRDVTLPHTVLVWKSRDDVTLTAVPSTIWKS